MAGAWYPGKPPPPRKRLSSLSEIVQARSCARAAESQAGAEALYGFPGNSRDWQELADHYNALADEAWNRLNKKGALRSAPSIFADEDD